MREVVVYELISLDGVAKQPGSWLFDAGEPVAPHRYGRVLPAGLGLFGLCQPTM